MGKRSSIHGGFLHEILMHSHKSGGIYRSPMLVVYLSGKKDGWEL